ncbi:MAG: N(4)-(beta-N-acetylglucosaminyl)-L-asparaginase [Anaerolineae bacterium]|nr:N(4)-(beta-N-acetylglucosaminyl)-L-asparaginase [Anaerolineae bacterium]MDW8098021.1 N(4)-(beta-N-acetylglucosaminyl)-L-asparaginase [Anaerolineae bacterium]
MRVIVANSEGGVGMAAAVEAMQQGRPALDVVELGIRPVEIDPRVHSVGVGGWPNLLGQVELDASIMDGRTLRAGAVGALRGFLHPISVARQVMERLPHVFLVGEGAARFAAECGAETGETLTEEARTKWEAWLRQHIPSEVWSQWPNIPLTPWVQLTTDPEKIRGTTVFLARDDDGNIAAGVSTSGWAFKYPGRLGDSPVIGAGNYADNRYGAAACTGMGEMTIRAGTAHAVVFYMKMGLSVVEACHKAVQDLRALAQAHRGQVTIHAIDAHGNPYVVTTGDADEVCFWIWMDGMEKPECRPAVVEPL